MKRLLAPRTLVAVALAAGLIAALIAAYWAFASHQKASQERAIGALVGETTAVLRDGLSGKASADDLKRIDAFLEKLHAEKVTRQRALADAADNYLSGSRAVLQRRIDAARFAQNAANVRRLVVAHLSAPRGRDDAWIRQATELKKRMDQAYFEESVALEALVELLRALPETGERLAPQLGRGALVEQDLILSAMRRTEDDLQRTAAERESAGKLVLRQ